MVKLGSTVILALLASVQARSLLRASTGGDLLASNLDLSVMSSEDDRAVILDGSASLLNFAKKDDEEADAGGGDDEEEGAKKKKKKKKAKKADDEDAGAAGDEEDAAPAKKKKGKKAKKADDAEEADAGAGGEDDAAPAKKKKGKKGKKGKKADDADAPEVDAGSDEEEAAPKKKKGKKGKKADDEEGAEAGEDAVDADAATAANATANATAVLDPVTGLPVPTPLPDALNATAPAADATATPADATAAAPADATAVAPADPTAAAPADATAAANATVTVNDDGSLGAVTPASPATTRPVADEFPTSPDCHPEALPEAKAMNDDKVCKAELPKFYDATTGHNFDDKNDKDKGKLMDKFCKSPCGNKYTQYVLAARKLDLTCAPSIQQLLVTSVDKAEVSRDEGQNHQGEASRDTGKKALEPPKNSIVGKRKEEPKKADPKKDAKKAKEGEDADDEQEDDAAVFGEDDKKKVEDVSYFGGITRAIGSGTYKPTGRYPGLTLGCLKAEDGKYCATKKAAMNDKHDGCQFYKSCCFGEYLVGVQNTAKLITIVEKKCPGSKAFATKLCKH